MLPENFGRYKQNEKIIVALQSLARFIHITSVHQKHRCTTGHRKYTKNT